jgi:membrane carboxypeptidase/penicillin-binding protein
MALSAMTFLAAVVIGAGVIWTLSILPRPLRDLGVLESFAAREHARVYDANDEFLAELHAERQIFVLCLRAPAGANV